MVKLILKRLLVSVFILLAVSVVVFAATLLLPGDPARAILGQQATEERLAALRTEMHLDRSPVERYLLWLGGLFVGNFGTSTTTGGPVADLLSERIGASLILMLCAAAIAVPVGVAIGI